MRPEAADTQSAAAAPAPRAPEQRSAPGHRPRAPTEALAVVMQALLYYLAWHDAVVVVAVLMVWQEAAAHLVSPLLLRPGPLMQLWMLLQASRAL